MGDLCGLAPNMEMYPAKVRICKDVFCNINLLSGLNMFEHFELFVVFDPYRNDPWRQYFWDGNLNHQAAWFGAKCLGNIS